MSEQERPGRRPQQQKIARRVTREVAPSGVVAAEMASEEQQAPAATVDQRRKPSWSMPKVTLALSAFIMSLVVTLISAYYALQGPEILVRPPEQLLLYRDGEGAQSVLGFDIRLDMINGASDYGDVMLDASLVPEGTGVSFAFQSVMRPVFSGAGPANKDCDLGSRCLDFSGLKLIEEPDALVDIPGSGAHAMHLSFPAAEWNCTGSKAACGRYADFEKALAALENRPLHIRIRLTFNRDGHREIRCRSGRIDGAYLREIGWMSLACVDRSVSGEPWL